MPYLEALSTFRAQVREAARGGGAAGAGAVLALCDALRDHVLPELGVRLEDKPGNNTYKNFNDLNLHLLETVQTL